MADPHHNQAIVAKRGEKGAQSWLQASEVLGTLHELARAGVPRSLLGNHTAEWVALVTKAKVCATFWLSTNDTFICEEPFGISGPIALSSATLLLRSHEIQKLHGTPGFEIAVGIEWAGKIIGVIACSKPQESPDALLFAASMLSTALSIQRELPTPVKELLQAKDPVAALPGFFSFLLGTLHRDRGAFFLVEPDGGVRALFGVGISESYLKGVLGVYRKGAGGIVQATQAPLQIEDVVADARIAVSRELMLAEKIRSVLLVPIVYQGQPIAGITVYSDRPGAFSHREVVNTQALGALLGPILVSERFQAIVRKTPTPLFYQGPSQAPVPLNPAAEITSATLPKISAPCGEEGPVSPFAQIPLPYGHLLALQTTLNTELYANLSSILLGASRALRDPLTVIWGYLGMIEGRMRRASPQDAPRLGRLQGSLQRLGQLADELQDLSQTSTGAPLQAVELSSLLAALPKEVGVDLVTLPSLEKPLSVRAEPTRLTRGLVLLLRYAARFATESQKAALRIEQRDQEVSLSLIVPAKQDTGGLRLAEGLGTSAIWLSSITRQWGGRFLLPTETQDDTLTLTLRAASTR